jgi:hypothetical protein
VASKHETRLSPERLEARGRVRAHDIADDSTGTLQAHREGVPQSYMHADQPPHFSLETLKEGYLPLLNRMG